MTGGLGCTGQWQPEKEDLLHYTQDGGFLNWSSTSSTSFLFSWQDMRPLKAGRCQYYSSGGNYGYIYDNFYTLVSSS